MREQNDLILLDLIRSNPCTPHVVEALQAIVFEPGDEDPGPDSPFSKEDFLRMLDAVARLLASRATGAEVVARLVAAKERG